MRGWSDERGQAIQVGAIILFGFLVVAFAGYQAVSVPSQNQNVEFQHSMAVTDQMQEFRADTIEAASTGATRSQAFKLGTSYPARLFAVNPPPASGRLATTTFGGGEYVLDAPGASLEDICGLSTGSGNSVGSQALVYEPDYNEYTQAPNVVYENTVTYREFPGKVRLDSGQTIIDGSTLTFVPLTGDVSESASATRTVDIFPGPAGVENISPTSSFQLRIPTALTADDWRTLLSDEFTPDGNVQSVTSSGGDVVVTLSGGEYTVLCPVNGLGKTPANEPSQELNRGGDGGSSLNPGDAGDVRLDSIERSDDDKDNIVLTFENTGDDVRLTEGRFNFYFSSNQNGPEQLDVLNTTAPEVLMAELQIRGETKDSSPEQIFSGGGSNTKLTISFDTSGNAKVQKKDYFVVLLRFSDGQESLYFVDIPQN
ncbi:hypothetical protein N0B31_04130 [Salinirubellus salinus]|uniref:Uncharacterized protein n=1 Tax=Salinirubellus salinus TaxID=1364945 RepID=A0A9E7R432_9EURY|nr:hypothetical protein [Salinirubellus salinus]UWM55476.1 hypothetical protein N0B31_04130 [Salinirubellus salinus]